MLLPATGEDNVIKGLVEIWFYDEEGNEEKSYENQYVISRHFPDHRYNQFVIGGNLFEPNFQKGVGDTGKVNQYYIDDFIIDDERIGLKYFTMLNAYAANPSCPKGFRKVQ